MDKEKLLDFLQEQKEKTGDMNIKAIYVKLRALIMTGVFDKS
ncbi:hypothetical protein [Robertmurraya siralis]|nr:hypothetical protein [Robertmurraya siralis]